MVTCSTHDNKKSHGFSRFYGNGISMVDDIPMGGLSGSWLSKCFVKVLSYNFICTKFDAMPLSYIWLILVIHIYALYIYYVPVVPGQAGGGSFQKEKNYIAQKEFAYRMCARRPTSAMPKSFLCCERAFCRSMVVMFCALK